MTESEAFIAGLPKAELHVHHVGSARPETVARLAARHPDLGVPQSPEELQQFFTFTDFDHFIEVYLSVVRIIRTGEDVRLLTYEVAEGLAEQQVRYAEITMTPVTSVRAGIPIEEYTEAIEDARSAAERDLGIVLRWIYDIPGEAGHDSAEATLNYALNHAPDALVGFGLGGPELPRPQFKSYFDRARAAGLHSVPHAGESTDAHSVWDALDLLGAERIGHGIRSIDDDRLVERLVADQIPLEVCPTSNVATRSVPSLEVHPLGQLVDAGVRVTINSDDPPMFNTTLNNEYAVAAQLLDLNERGLADLALAAVGASFAPDQLKTTFAAEIEQYLQPSAD